MIRQILAALLVLVLLSPLRVEAFNATSTNFYIRQNVQSTSGGSATYSVSTSTSFNLLGAGGQTAVGTSTPGTNYTLFGGFLRNMFKSVKPVYSVEHYHWRRDNGSETTATALIAEDTATTSVAENLTQRLRIALSNEGGTEAQYATQAPRLEYGLKVTTCSAIVSWTDVAAVGGDFDMSNTANLTNGGDTTNISTATGGVTDPNKTFISDNNAVLDTASAPSALLISSDSFMELEYAILANTAATDGATYCFRLTNAGTATLYTPTIYPEAQIASSNTLPVASAVSIDSGASSVTLTENTTKNVVCAGTVTDNDGYANISAVGAFLYRTSVGTTSASDNNNLYRLYGDSQCVPSGGSGSSETYTCTFPVEYYADATDTGSPYPSDTWSCELHPRDAVATGTPATDTTEMASLMALDVTSSIAYGSVDANADTGSTNQTTTVTNTGNRDMDPEVSGASMTGAGTITASQQKYLASAFTYTSGGTALSGTPTQINLSLPQRTSDGGGAVTSNLLWGLGVPNGTPNGGYTGTNTFTAAAALGGISIAQTMPRASASNVAISTGTFSSTPTTGNTVIVVISGWQDPTGFGITTVSDNKGNTYHLADESGCSGGSGNHLCYAGIYYAENVTSSATFTVTVDPPNTGNYLEWQAVEVSGLQTSSSKDRTLNDSGGGATNAAVGPTAATTVADELVVAVTSVSINDTNLNISTPSGYTQIGINNDANATIGYEASYKTVSTTGTQSASWSHDNLDSNDEWAAAIATFKGQ